MHSVVTSVTYVIKVAEKGQHECKATTHRREQGSDYIIVPGSRGLLLPEKCEEDRRSRTLTSRVSETLIAVIHLAM